VSVPPYAAGMALAYLGFVGAAIALIFARRWVRPNGGPSDTWKKTPSYLLMNVGFLAAIVLPDRWPALVVLLAVLGAAASWELSSALRLAPLARATFPALSAALVLASGWVDKAGFILLCLAAIAVGAGVSALGARNGRGARLAAVAGCLGYLPLCLGAFVWIRGSASGALAAILLYGAVANSDAYAQITGQLVGTRALAPTISPAKTVEGALGGVLAGALFTAALCAIAGLPALQGAAVGAVVALAGLTGDLAASGLKRRLGLKDFSPLLGVHGGVLDRFDSLLFAAPVFFLLMTRWPLSGV
jgi:phosphatidate cytidylyltransferase